MSATRKALGTLATGAMVLGFGFITAPAAQAEAPQSGVSPQLEAEILAEPWPTYAEGESHNNVAVAKVLLALDGYYDWEPGQDPADEVYFGADLTAALYEMQEDHNIGENGEIHGEVWDYFMDRQFAGGAANWGPDNGRYYDTPDVGGGVWPIQRMLVGHGYLEPGGNTGSYADTVEELTAFQSETCRSDADPDDPQPGDCLDDDGYTGVLTWRALVTGGLGPA